ncbi:MAG TPA: endoglucanase [Lachnospiraceae bacterium]|nr:endoglucanase [Lachnospiraceae bacterium]
MKRISGFVKGVNLGGWLSQCAEYTYDHYDTFITESDVDNVAKLGFDHVRVPVDYNVIERGDNDYIEEGFKYIDECIRWCKKNGLKMIIDLHKTYGYSFDPLDKIDRVDFFTNEANIQRFINLWKYIGKRYAEYSDFVCYELLNEIIRDEVAEDWNKVVMRTIAAIREVAPDSMIIFGGVRYNSITSVPMLVDPKDDKVIYTFHCYDPLIFTHQAAYWVEGMPSDFRIDYPGTIEEYREKSLMLTQELGGALYTQDFKSFGPEFFEQLFQPALKIAEERNIPLYCGEYGVIDQADPGATVRWMKDINTVFEKYGIGRAYWNYKEKDFGLISGHYDSVMDDMMSAM